MPFRKILCPVDFSQTSREALHRAADIAHADGATLTLMHVLPAGGLPGMGAAPVTVGGLAPFRSVPAEHNSPGAEHAARTLAEWRDALAHDGLQCGEEELAAGDPAAEILRVAKDGRFDLVVLGTHGKTGVLGALLGNVSYKVVRTASCSVLTVRAQEDQ